VPPPEVEQQSFGVVAVVFAIRGGGSVTEEVQNGVTSLSVGEGSPVFVPSAPAHHSTQELGEMVLPGSIAGFATTTTERRLRFARSPAGSDSVIAAR
jgi:hypothetical protein